MEVNFMWGIGVFVWGGVFGSSLIALGMYVGHSIWAPKKPKPNGKKRVASGGLLNRLGPKLYQKPAKSEKK